MSRSKGSTIAKLIFSSIFNGKISIEVLNLVGKKSTVYWSSDSLLKYLMESENSFAG